MSLLTRFFKHISDLKPLIFVTYNGDGFDWPYVCERAKQHNLSMESEIGVFENTKSEFMGRCAIHMDCFYWVKRNSYLPQGSQGLKAVTRIKLGYEPVEVNPEKMVEYARNKPNQLAHYSVSDALATYYLYVTMIHDFVFALATIIPTFPDEVLRLGSGTLCENVRGFFGVFMFFFSCLWRRLLEVGLFFRINNMMSLRSFMKDICWIVRLILEVKALNH